MTNRKFGVEIESSGPRNVIGNCFNYIRNQNRNQNRNLQTPPLTAPLGLPSDPALFPNPALWTVSSDASVRCDYGSGHNPLEVQSAPLSGIEGIQEVRKMLRLMRSVNCEVNSSCGLHVHFDMTGERAPMFRRLSQIWVMIEPVVDLMIPPSRRTSQYANSNLRAFMGPHYYDRHTVCSSYHRYGSPSNPSGANLAMMVLNHLTTQSNRDEIVRAMAAGGRYWKMNMASFQVHRTVEFRMHAGSLNSRKTANWILFLDYVMQKAASRDPITITTEAWTPEFAQRPLDERVRWVCRFLGVRRKTREYWIDRVCTLRGNRREPGFRHDLPTAEAQDAAEDAVESVENSLEAAVPEVTNLLAEESEGRGDVFRPAIRRRRSS